MCRLSPIFSIGYGVSGSIPEDYFSKDFYSNIISGNLKVDKIERGHVTCHLTVHPVIANYYDGLHGGAVAAIAERVAIACAKTVIAEDKEIFLGELSISYLSAAPKNEELIVDGSIVRSGKNVTVVATELKFKKTGKLAFTSRATFYNIPVAKL
ncbi:acyl-coenzyme A thioesterase 13-like [Melia azedarach]|uniref:Acyl-coenzyme A thioesterase 13-like n=1 Tax=Melia azedarach TaxID=155640 RepID=A0ACC1YT58_MELAZ|nr:acyl-coenzyme A thioesterase 13-like [Melia azedarach]